MNQNLNKFGIVVGKTYCITQGVEDDNSLVKLFFFNPIPLGSLILFIHTKHNTKSYI